ncbi:MAG: hypothetical protein MJ231_09240 [bacterium]|nr:hypothetical protein [bacterium]
MGIFNIENAGKKVKNVAKVMLIVNLILTFVIAIVEGDALPDRLEVIIPFLIIVFGIVLSYISYVILYAFGELVENSKSIKERINQKN